MKYEDADEWYFKFDMNAKTKLYVHSFILYIYYYKLFVR